VAASAEGHTPAAVTADTRDPRGDSSHLELRLGGCAARLRGTVRDASGGVVAGAQIAVDDAAHVGGARSDTAGRYELCVAPGAWLRVDADGYGALRFLAPSLPGDAVRDLALVPAASVVGRVLRGGGPAPGARVILEPLEHGLTESAPHATFADGEGRFRLERAGAGLHRLVALSGDEASAPVEVRLRPTEATPEIHLRLSATAPLRGLVIEAGRPLAGARVSFRRSDGITSDAAFTDDAGRFVARRVPRGRVVPRVDGRRVIAPASLVAGAGEVRIETAPLAALDGTVVRAGRPVAGASVRTEGSPVYRSARSDGDGRFHLGGLTAGAYLIVAADEEGGAAGWMRGVTLADGEARGGLVIELGHGAAVRGVVVDGRGDGVASVFVELHEATSALRAYALTSARGEFVAPAVGDGEYQAFVKRHEEAPAPLEPLERAPTISVRNGRDVDGVRLVVRRDALTIAGTVEAAGGGPAADVLVRALRDGEPASGWYDVPRALSAADGRFAIGELQGGSYTLEAIASDGGEARLLSVRAGDGAVVVRLAATGRIEGELVGFHATPDVAAARDATPLHAAVDGARFAVEAVAPGTYLVSANAPSEVASATVTVAPGATATVVLRAEEGTPLAGTVRELRSGAGVGGLRCEVTRRLGAATAGALGDEAWSDETGRFSFARVGSSPGRIVFCHGDGPFGPVSDGAAAVDEGELVVPVVRKSGPLGMLGFKLDGDQPFVPVVTLVRPGQPGERAGLVAGDVIVALDGVSTEPLLTSGVDLLARDRPAGTPLRLTLRRGGARLDATLVVGRWQ
jgi:hypothetical protein